MRAVKHHVVPLETLSSPEDVVRAPRRKNKGLQAVKHHVVPLETLSVPVDVVPPFVVYMQKTVTPG